MAFTYAILLSSSLWTRTASSTTLHAASNATFKINRADTHQPASIFSDINYTLVNTTGVVKTDKDGNYSVYLDPSYEYEIVYQGVTYPKFDPDPSGKELQAEIAAHASQTSGVHGANSGDPLATQNFVNTAIANGATGGATPDASDVTKGKLALTGDLGGTAASPAINSVLRNQITGAVQTSQIGANNGVAGLDSGGKVPSSQLPAGSTPDATTGANGVVRLAGDLAGTGGSAAAPKISDTLRGQITGAQPASEKGNANGYASLDSGGKIPTGQLPAGGFSGDFGGATATNYKSPPISKSAAFTPSLTESGRFYGCNTGTGSGFTVTLPNTATPGTFWIFQTANTAPLTFAAQSGGYLVQKDSQFRMTAQNSVVTAFCLSGSGSNAGFILWGDVAV